MTRLFMKYNFIWNQLLQQLNNIILQDFDYVHLGEDVYKDLNIKSETDISLLKIFNHFFQNTAAKQMFLQNLSHPIKNIHTLQTRYTNLSFFLQLSIAITVPQFTALLNKLKTQANKSDIWRKFQKSIINFMELKKIFINFEDAPIFIKDLQYVEDQLLIRFHHQIEQCLDLTQDEINIKAGVSSQIDRISEVQKQLNYMIEIAIQKQKQELIALGNDQIESIRLTNVFEIGYLVIVEDNVVHPENWKLYKQQDGYNFYQTELTQQLDEHFSDLQNHRKLYQDQVLFSLIQELDQLQDYFSQIDQILTEIEYYHGLSQAAKKMRLIIPEIQEEHKFKVINGRHILVEQNKEKFEQNSLDMQDGKSIFILTGPNQSGKSIYIKMIALIIYMAHVGLPVAADKAVIGKLDSIHTLFPQNACSLIQSNDNDLIRLSKIFNNFKGNTLIIFDELGKNFKFEIGCTLFLTTLSYLSKMKNNNLVLVASHLHQVIKRAQQEIQSIQIGEMLANIIDEDKIEFIYKVRILNDKYEMNNSNGLQIGYMIHKDKQLLIRSRQIMDQLLQRRQYEK